MAKTKYMSPIYKTLVLAILLTFFTVDNFAQKVVELSTAKRNVLILPGKRVKYKLRDGSEDAGKIKIIDDSLVSVNDKTIKIDDIVEIGKKSRGSNFIGIFLTGLGGLTAIAIVQNLGDQNDPCPSCQQNSSTTDDSVGVALVGSLALAGIGVTILATNTTKNVTSKWTIRIIDKPAKN